MMMMNIIVHNYVYMVKDYVWLKRGVSSDFHHLYIPNNLLQHLAWKNTCKYKTMAT
jgi:hypothetical protein